MPCSHQSFDVERIRQDFPILSQQVYDKPLVYFDSGASAQKPRAVIDAISNVYETAICECSSGRSLHESEGNGRDGIVPRVGSRFH